VLTHRSVIEATPQGQERLSDDLSGILGSADAPQHVSADRAIERAIRRLEAHASTRIVSQHVHPHAVTALPVTDYLSGNLVSVSPLQTGAWERGTALMPVSGARAVPFGCMQNSVDDLTR
jgi:hypothetical protein